MNKNLQTVLEKPMNRKQFLGYIGAAVLSVIGVTGMLKAIMHGGSTPKISHNVKQGYGGSSYGGETANNSLRT